ARSARGGTVPGFLPPVAASPVSPGRRVEGTGPGDERGRGGVARRCGRSRAPCLEPAPARRPRGSGWRRGGAGGDGVAEGSIGRGAAPAFAHDASRAHGTPRDGRHGTTRGGGGRPAQHRSEADHVGRPVECRDALRRARRNGGGLVVGRGDGSHSGSDTAPFLSPGGRTGAGTLFSPRHRSADVPAHVDSFAGRERAILPRVISVHAPVESRTLVARARRRRARRRLLPVRG